VETEAFDGDARIEEEAKTLVRKNLVVFEAGSPESEILQRRKVERDVPEDGVGYSGAFLKVHFS